MVYLMKLRRVGKRKKVWVIGDSDQYDQYIKGWKNSSASNTEGSR